jgi:anaerobic magnesium-protoporphyrin IX monomethyl ester cyclase
MRFDLSGNIDVLFVIPPVLKFMNRSSNSYPLGMGYMVSYLKSDGISSAIFNADMYRYSSDSRRYSIMNRAKNYLRRKLNLNPSYNVDFALQWPNFHDLVGQVDRPEWDEVRKVLMKLRPKILGIGSKVVDIPSTFMLARIAKETLPDVKVVVGGPSATTLPEHLMAEHSIDFLIRGEGELTMLELARRLLGSGSKSGLQDINGLVFRREENLIVTNPPRPLIPNLDEIPFPDRQAMFMVNDSGMLEVLVESRSVLTSRGCPYNCRFCSAYLAWGTHKPRFRTIDNIIEELILLRQYDQQPVIFWDDLFTVNRDRVLQLCKRIITERLGINWICLARIDKIDRQMLEIMKDAGCIEIQVGIESGNDRILRYIRKSISIDTIRRQASLINQVGLPWRIFLIIGFPTETESEIQDTINLISEIRPTFVDLSLFCPYPGSDLHVELERMGRLGANFMKSDMWYPYNNYTATMSDSKFTRIALKALKLADAYNDRNSLK